MRSTYCPSSFLTTTRGAPQLHLLNVSSQLLQCFNHAIAFKSTPVLPADMIKLKEKPAPISATAQWFPKAALSCFTRRIMSCIRLPITQQVQRVGPLTPHVQRKEGDVLSALAFNVHPTHCRACSGSGIVSLQLNSFSVRLLLRVPLLLST